MNKMQNMKKCDKNASWPDEKIPGQNHGMIGTMQSSK